MIYVTGDTHGELSGFLDRLYENDAEENSTIIVAGDFGFVWTPEPERIAALRELSRLSYTICFVDGNHEGYDYLYTFPEENWNGGRIHRIEKNIVHLTRGQIFTIGDKSFYTFGGAYSRDKIYRRPHISWWEQEIPDALEYKTGAENLEKAGYKVDYVITHQIPSRFIYRLDFRPNENDLELTSYLDWLYDNLEFSKWFSGHWHINRSFDSGKMNILYEDLVSADDRPNG